MGFISHSSQKRGDLQIEFSIRYPAAGALSEIDKDALRNSPLGTCEYEWDNKQPRLVFIDQVTSNYILSWRDFSIILCSV